MCVPPLLLWAFWGVGDRISLQAGSNLLCSPAWYQLTIPLTQPLECWDYRCEHYAQPLGHLQRICVWSRRIIKILTFSNEMRKEGGKG